MPSLRLWCGMLFLCAAPLGYAAQKPAPAPKPVKAPEQPSAALLEFIGDWDEDERRLIGMETHAETLDRKQKTKEVRRAP
jgi:Spy/CpxP family protein refolding chaperone